MLLLSASGQWRRCLPPPRSPPVSPPLPVAFVWRVLWVCVCMSVCVFGFQTNFLEFLPLLCVSPHVTSPAVAEAAAAAAAAAAPGIRLEQEPRSLLRSSSPSSVPSGRRSLDPGAAGGR
ncbi:unnamed protein product [Rangifer tarandus platyrhynchus]|uniref:Uncharacterized protein n=1 Tax=Rangifer tarandus platyrhynchus TaxID=3082113 RepID=A0AC59ZLQ0_RANTA